MAFKKLKTKILESSDMYNFYKNEYESNKNIREINKVLDSYNSLFNTIFLDYELQPKPLLDKTFTLCQELLAFVANVCKKYDLEYWLDYGNLLGAYRHGGFIPWDDDIDIGMMREDYNKFIEVFEDELKEHNLDNDITFSIKRYYNGKKLRLSVFAKIVYLPNDDMKDTFIYYSDKLMFAGLDIFPYDFVKNPDEVTEEKYKNFRNEFFIDLCNGVSREKVFEKYYDFFNLSYEKQDYFIPGIEGTWGASLYDFDILETDKVFPLSSISFRGRDYPCPKDCKYYLEALYGENYMTVPQKIRNHSRQKQLRTIDNVLDKFDEYIAKLKAVNDSFE